MPTQAQYEVADNIELISVLQEWEEGPVQDHFAYEYSTQHWRGV